MKYLVILIGIIGLVTYIFVSGPKAVTGADEPPEDRRQLVWDRIAQLEGHRRDMLLRAQGRVGGYSAVSKLSRRGVYAAGFREGFSEGYFEGSFLGDSHDHAAFFTLVPYD